MWNSGDLLKQVVFNAGLNNLTAVKILSFAYVIAYVAGKKYD